MIIELKDGREIEIKGNPSQEKISALLANIAGRGGEAQQQPTQKSQPVGEQRMQGRESMMASLIQDPSTMQRFQKHPLGTTLRTLGGAAELYQGVPASVGLDLQAGQPQNILPNLLKVLTGQRPAQYGDVFSGSGMPEPLAAGVGTASDLALAPGGARLMKGAAAGGAGIAKAGINKLMRFEKITQQADKSKAALDALQKSYGSAYEVAINAVKDVPTEVDFSKMPKRILDLIRNEKDTYGVKFNPNGSLDTSLGNVNKIKEAADDVITPAVIKEAPNKELGQIKEFSGYLSSTMRKAARKVGKPIDEAVDAYGKFKNDYNLVNDRLLDRRGNAMANKLKEMFRLTSEPLVKNAWKTLSKESPELKEIMASRKNRELLKTLLKTTASVGGVGAVGGVTIHHLSR